MTANFTSISNFYRAHPVDTQPPLRRGSSVDTPQTERFATQSLEALLQRINFQPFCPND
jgi:hypothetical protein